MGRKKHITINSRPYYDQLLTEGVVVITDTCFAQNVAQYREAFLEETKRFQEFKPGTTQFVLGGYAALGNPSSFHNMTVRMYRE